MHSVSPAAQRQRDAGSCQMIVIRPLLHVGLRGRETWNTHWRGAVCQKGSR